MRESVPIDIGKVGGFESPYLHQGGRYLELNGNLNETGQGESFQ